MNKQTEEQHHCEKPPLCGRGSIKRSIRRQKCPTLISLRPQWRIQLSTWKKTILQAG